MGQVVIWPLFAATCVASVVRPWLGLVGFYFFALLDPGWNWRWSIPRDFPFQYYIGISVIFGWMLSGFHGRYPQGKGWWPHIGLVTFLALAFLSSLQSIDKSLSTYYMSTIWKIVVMSLLATFLIDSPKKILVLMAALVFAQGYNALQINLQYFRDGFSLFARDNWAGGTKGDNNVYTIFTLAILAVSLSICVAKHPRWLRASALLVALLQIHQIMLLESRGGMLGSLLLGCLLVYYVPKSAANLAVMACVVAIGVVLAGEPVIREFRTIFAGRDNLDSSAESRFRLWKAGVAISADYPFLGVGPWAGSMLVPSYYDGGLDVKRKELHNQVLEVSTGSGIPATVAYLAFFSLPWFWCVRKFLAGTAGASLEPAVYSACIAAATGIPAYYLAGMFSSGSLLESGYLLAVIGIAASQVSCQEAPGPDIDSNDMVGDDPLP